MILLHISHGVLWQLYILVVAWPPDHPFVCRISYVLPVGMKYFFFLEGGMKYLLASKK